MKKTITVLCLGLGMSISAQDTTKITTCKIVQEEYLANLFKGADVIYCKVDDVNDHVAVKNMEVAFYVDSSVFLTAYIESNEYKKNASGPLWCTYVELDDTTGRKLKMAYQTPSNPLARDEDALNDLDILKPILDSLLQKTAIVDYSKDTKVFIDLDED